MKPKILLVDDQQELRVLLADSFKARGYEVMEASDGASLRAAFSGQQPDVSLLDLKLPDADGLELLTALKAQWPDTEAIVLTGFGSLDHAVEATKRGAFHFQTKPHNDGLFNLVERALERKQQSQENSKLIDALKRMSGDSSPIFHSRVSLPTRNRAGPGRISGRWQSRRTLVEPVWAGIRVLPSNTENIAVGA